MEEFKPDTETAPQSPTTPEVKISTTSPESRTSEQREAILQILQPRESSSLRRIFTDEQIEAAKSSEEEFHNVLEKACINNPELAFRVMEEVPDFWDREQIRRHIDALAEYKPNEIIKNFSRIRNYESPEEQKNLIRRALNGVESYHKGTMVQFYFSNPDIVAQFDPVELREMVISMTQKSRVNSIYPKYLKGFVDQNILTPEDMREIGLRVLSEEEPYLQDEGEFFQYFTDPEDKKKFKDALKKAFLRKNEPLSLGHIDSHGKLLSEEEKAEIFRERIKILPKDGIGYLEMMFKYLTPEEVHKNIVEAIRRKESDFYNWNWRTVLGKKILTPEEEREMWQVAVEIRPTLTLAYINEYLELFPESERQQVLLEVVERAGPQAAIGDVEKWIAYVPEDKQKEKITEMMLSESGYSFLTRYLAERKNQDVPVLLKMFSEDEIRTILDRQLELGVSRAFAALKPIREFLGSDRALKEHLASAITKDPAEVVRNLSQVKYLYQPDEIKNLIDTVGADSRGLSACIVNIENWAPILGKDYTWKFLQQAKDKGPQFIISDLSGVIGYVPPEERANFIIEAIKSNPPVAYYENKTIEKYLPGTTSATILQMAQEDQDRISYAPKTLPELYKRMAKISDVKDAEPLVIEGFELYESINFIRSKGWDPIFRSIQNTEGISQKLEPKALETFKALAMLSEVEGGFRPEQAGDIKSIAEADRLLFQELSKRMNLGREVTEEESKRFMDEMETPVPFLTYYLQYEKSPEHKKILSEIFNAILNGKYDDWKYGLATEEGLQEMKDKKLLPESLTLEQYIAWRQDDSTELFESLAANAENVSREIRRTLLDNAEHIKNPVLESSTDDPEEMLSEIAKELVNLGQESGVVNKELSLLRKTDLSSDPEGAKRSDMLAKRKDELDIQKKQLTTARSILRLLTLLPQEISADYLLEGEDRKKKGDKISAVLEGVKRNIPEEGHFVLDNISKLIDQFRNQNQEKQNLRCIDSSRPKHLFEVGAKPISSCQHYGHGSHNDCLLGYSGPDTKILVLQNEQGNIVARSIFRILAKDGGQPGEHAERIYASSASSGIARSIYTHLTKKGEKSEIPVYTSQSSQDEQGVETGVIIPPGFEFVQSPDRLHSYNSRAPKVYVDSAGGVRSFGKYTMENLFEIKKQPNK